MSIQMHLDKKKPREDKRRLPWLRHAKIIIGMAVLAGIAIASWLHVPFSPCLFLRAGSVTLACPLGTLEVNLAAHAIIWDMAPGFLLVCCLLFILGRMWCGWVCPASLAGKALNSTGSFLLPGLHKVSKKIWRGLGARLQSGFRLGSAHALGFLGGILLGAFIFQYPFWCILCPLGIVSRAIIEGAVHLSLRWDVMLLVIPLVAMLCFRFGWKCACPVGLVHGLGATANRTFVAALDKAAPKACNQCGHCRALCPTGLYPAREAGQFSCTKCLRCIEGCPRGCLTLKIFSKREAVKEINP